MNSTLLRTIAILMAIGAVVTAWLGYRLSANAAKPPMPQVQVTYPQLVAARDLPAGEILTASDVRIDSLPQRDPSGLTSPQQAVGKVLLSPLPKDTPLLGSHFPVLNPVAQSLRPAERALAIKVNEVIGVGGYLKPGDHVDVLLYLRGERETSDISSAQVVLSDVRVLAYGDDTTQPEDHAANPAAQPNAVEQGVKKLNTATTRDGKSAILAVPEHEAARLMLAENSGILRLALRGANVNPNAAAQGERYFVRLDAIGKSAAEPLSQPSQSTRIIRKPVSAAAAGSQVIVHQGDQLEVIRVKP